ncbi:HK97 family phage prohead protease [Allokutzneria sp. A3M-2-11 16]|uniref:HK97 family phage prohead protease n=1 Tax=Allokutzneria sp. A3M-2-11 16 TaxID=2962043 RepID=UPI0020B8DFC2|nr:HK97 family phage prohead protease [Allokutzneria sp. A3M-2-11 16]MCP3805381.1 HK97 family phage prohead protease [Allokutzneria sp. A3M-2-11 16]
MHTKSLSRVEIKDAEAGTVSAVFSTFDVVDAHGDVTLAGAFADGAPVVISAYGHGSWEGKLPVGKGVIRATDTEAILDGTFFLSTVAGRETFEVVKALAEDSLGEWSYGYDADEYSFGEHADRHVRFLKALTVHEVSPVLLGAGVNTRTLTVKSGEGMTFADHAAAVLAAVTGLTGRAADVLAKRREKGKSLGEVSAQQLKQIRDELTRLEDLLAPGTETTPASPETGAAQEFLRFLAHSAQLAKE